MPSRSSLRSVAAATPFLLCLGLPFLGACSILVEGAIPEDPPPSDSCMGLADGTTCTRDGITAPLICLAGLCTNSRCGDGQLDLRPKEDGTAEVCDDGNSDGSDGCEPDCTVSVLCTMDEECPTPEIPCIVGTCNVETGQCGTDTAPNDTACNDGDNDGVCMDGSCVAANCGNGTMEAGEQCDDSNLEAGDGCSPFCKPECLDNNSCQQDACLGYERCEVTTGATGQIGICLPDETRPVLTCATPCELCDSLAGACAPAPEADGDFDGHPSMECGGDDCDDTNPDINPGLAETCGDGVDSNCNGDTDEGSVSDWYADCDDDLYASSSSTPITSCGPPTGTPTGCTDGDWTTRAPAGSYVDCLDTDPEVRPGQREYFASAYSDGRDTSFDYDCDGAEEPEFARVLSPSSVACNSRCDSATVVSLTAACGALTTRYECVMDGRVCARTPNPLRYYLHCH